MFLSILSCEMPESFSAQESFADVAQAGVGAP
jgi:hypothetical protein